MEGKRTKLITFDMPEDTDQHQCQEFSILFERSILLALLDQKKISQRQFERCEELVRKASSQAAIAPGSSGDSYNTGDTLPN